MGITGLSAWTLIPRTWGNVHVRRAVAYALNRTDLIAATGSPSTPITTLIPPIHLQTLGSKSQIAAIVKSLPGYPFDVAKAKQEVAQSATPHGFSATIKTNRASQAPVLQVIAAQLQQIGIKLTRRGCWRTGINQSI